MCSFGTTLIFAEGLWGFQSCLPTVSVNQVHFTIAKQRFEKVSRFGHVLDIGEANVELFYQHDCVHDICGKTFSLDPQSSPSSLSRDKGL